MNKLTSHNPAFEFVEYFFLKTSDFLQMFKCCPWVLHVGGKLRADQMFCLIIIMHIVVGLPMWVYTKIIY